MPEKTAALEQLTSFLNRLFQFDTQDLDFGIYKILHYKWEQIQRFIDELLVERIQNQLISLKDSTVMDLESELAELEEAAHIRKWLEARAGGHTQKVAFYEEEFKEDTQRYKRIKLKIDAARAERDTQAVIYNHLTVFFSRYYDNGDFISKRRFGKNEKYAVPYNGEETHFYWANHDQYYIKSSETFRKYAFKAPGLTQDLIVSFKLTDAWIEQGNIKEGENKYFVLSEQEPVLSGNELTVYFEYRPLNDKEKRDMSNQGKQDKLNVSAGEHVRAKFGKDPATTQLWIEEDGESLFLRKLHHYTRKNHYDFFVHKNLKGFLQRELDFYIKSELVRVDDLYVLETEQHFENVRLNFKAIKVFKNIADTIIDFLSQIEEFQKKLWEKKKFVIRTDWVITIDKLVEWLGQDLARPFLEEALNNEAQQQEWRDLFGEEALPHDRTVSSLGQNLFGWKKLPIDTVHFPPEFKEHLLNALSEKIDLEDMTDGLVIHSDNFHGLATLQEKLNSLADVVYIDPPYNTDASAILYKNGFKDSSYFSLLQQTVGMAHSIMKENGILCAAIDDEEVVGLRTILSELFYKQVGIAVVRSNPAGRKTKGKLAPAHEYALFFGKSPESIPLSLEITPERLARYPKTDEKGQFAWANFIRSGSGDKRKDRPKMFYPIFVSEKDAIRIPAMRWDDEKGEYILLESPSANETPVLPVVKNGDTTIEKRWQRGHERVAREIDEFRIRRSPEGDISIDFKTHMDEGSLPTTWWDKKEYASANYGAAELKDLFGTKIFDFAKSRKLVMDCIRAAGGTETSRYVVDFFPGSGTTFDAVLRLNQADEQKRKCILIEQGEYVYSIIIPRIKKIATTFDWKDGRPKNGTMNGLGVFFKYQRLEQYEEALENIAFTKDEATVQTALELDVYMPKYFLNFETQGSRTLVNVEDLFDPWNYTLRVWDGFTYDTEQAVDIPETFNYLIGLHMQKCITREIGGKRYQFVQGVNNDNKRVLVVWRNVKAWGLEDYKFDSQVLKDELAAFQYDLLYINGQAHFEGYLPVEEVFKNRMVL